VTSSARELPELIPLYLEGQLSSEQSRRLADLIESDCEVEKTFLVQARTARWLNGSSAISSVCHDQEILVRRVLANINADSDALEFTARVETRLREKVAIQNKSTASRSGRVVSKCSSARRSNRFKAQKLSGRRSRRSVRKMSGNKRGWQAALISAAALLVVAIFVYDYRRQTDAVLSISPRLVSCRGTVFLAGTSGRKALKPGDYLVPGGMLEVGISSQARICYRDGTSIDIKESGRLLLVEPDSPWGQVKNLELKSGSLLMRVSPQKKSSPMTVLVGTCRVTVLGTTLSVQQISGKTQIEVHHGRVRVDLPTSGKATELAAGQYVLADSQGKLLFGKLGIQRGQDGFFLRPGDKQVVLRQGLDGYQGTDDAHIYGWSESHKKFNYGDKEEMYLREGAEWFRGLIRFKIFNREGGPIPDDVEIVSARMVLNQLVGYSFRLKVNRLLRNWREDQVTFVQACDGLPWHQPGAYAKGQDVASRLDTDVFVERERKNIECNLTQALRSMALKNQNNGWLLEIESAVANIKKIASSECPTVSQRPKMIIIYRKR
jgi:FecR protein